MKKIQVPYIRTKDLRIFGLIVLNSNLTLLDTVRKYMINIVD